MVECLTRDRGTAGLSLTGVTGLWSLSKTHLSYISTGSIQVDLSLFNWKIVDRMLRIKSNKQTKSLIFRYKSCHVLQRIKFVIAFNVEGCHHFCQMMSGFIEDSNSFLICQRSRPLAAMFFRDQVCFICFVVGHR